MDMHALITFINVRHNTHFTLHEKFATGENQGAYALSDDIGVGYVLKWNERPTWLRSLCRAEQITNHLATRGMPVPKYVLAATRPDNITYWIQTALPGLPPEALRLTHVERKVSIALRQIIKSNSGTNPMVTTLADTGQAWPADEPASRGRCGG